MVTWFLPAQRLAPDPSSGPPRGGPPIANRPASKREGMNLLAQEVANESGDRLGLLQVGGVAGLVHGLDARAGKTSRELLRVRWRDDPVFLPPDEQGGRPHAMDPLLESLVRDRPEE